jgi:hypothetical protein
MDQHGGGIALLPSQLAMGEGGDGIAVLIGQLGSAQTLYQIVNQLRKMYGALFIAQKKVVEFGGAIGSDQPSMDQSGLTAGLDCGHALYACGLRFIIRQPSRMRNWVFEWSRHLHHLLGTTNTKIVAEPP